MTIPFWRLQKLSRFYGRRAAGRPSSPDTNADANDLGFAALDATAPLAPNKAIVLPSTSLDDYVGTYKLADKILLKALRMNDGLFARVTGQAALPIFPSAPNEFFAKIAQISLSFTRDPNGAVSGLVLHQMNGDRAAPKLSACELPSEPKEIELDAATLGDYVGNYQLRRRRRFHAQGGSSRNPDHRATSTPHLCERQGQVLSQGC
jgi:hypothetical protein